MLHAVHIALFSLCPYGFTLTAMPVEIHILQGLEQLINCTTLYTQDTVLPPMPYWKYIENASNMINFVTSLSILRGHFDHSTSQVVLIGDASFCISRLAQMDWESLRIWIKTSVLTSLAQDPGKIQQIKSRLICLIYVEVFSDRI